MVMKRRKIPPKTAKQVFTKTAQRTHKKNVAPPPMRGGYRL